MHWIESLFGIAPDGGSGATESAILVAIVAVLVIVLRALYRKRRASDLL